MRLPQLVAAVAAAASLLACGMKPPAPHYAYTGKIDGAYPAGCTFEVLAAMPGGGYTELGVLDFAEGMTVMRADRFKAAVAPQVCAAGGDAVVTQINGSGEYVRGVVLKKQAGR